MLLSLLPLLSLSGVFAADPPRPATNQDFALTAQVVTALEGGPLVVKVSLCYRGTKRLNIYPMGQFRGYAPHITPDKNWQERPPRVRVVSFSGFVSASTTIDPGHRWEGTCFLHHRYERIPAGRVRLRLSDTVYGAGRRSNKPHQLFDIGPPLAHASTTLTVNVPQATPQNIASLKQQIEQEIAACARLPEGRDLFINPRHEQAKRLAETLRYCPHKALLPSALKLIALRDSGLDLPSLIQHVYDTSASTPKAHALFRDYLLSPEPTQAPAIFSFWAQLDRDALQVGRGLFSPRNLPFVPVGFMLDPSLYILALDCQVSYWKAYRRLLPNTEVQCLKQARNVWVRALTWVTLPRHCEPRWVEALKADLRRLNRPLPATEFQRLLGQLDSPRFPVRERAAADLLHVGDGAAPALREALKQRLSLELRRRIERVLEDIDGGRFDPLRYETLTYLASRGTPEARAVLQTLAEGLPQARLTKEAMAAQQQGKEYRPKQPEMPRQPLPKPELAPPEGKK